MALVIWSLFAFLVPSFVQALNLVDVLAFPLGYFMAAQGILIAFVIIGVLSARRQDRRDARRAPQV
jgi:putative solute:sodium symporter small subunit